VALFPRLSQVMIGVNNCDYHVYANGYKNTPGVTEPATCPGQTVNPDGSAANPTLQGEVFTGQVMGNPAMYNRVSPDRHMWRVMAQLDTTGGQNGSGSTGCGLFTNPGDQPTSNCYPGAIGTENYRPAAAKTATPKSSTSAPAPTKTSVWTNLWNFIVGTDSNA
jgi:hypothetical protein